MVINNNFCCSRKGSSMFFTMLLALIVTSGTIIVAYYLSSFRPKPVLPVSALIASDYYMESAAILQLQKSKNKPNEVFKPYEKEILPGIKMSLTEKKSDDNSSIYQLRVWGRELNRRMSILSHNGIADKLIYCE